MQSIRLAMTLPASSREHSTCLREYSWQIWDRLIDLFQLIALDSSDVAMVGLNIELIYIQLLTINDSCWNAALLVFTVTLRRDTLIWTDLLHLGAYEELHFLCVHTRWMQWKLL
jgi:hypothetical protein